MSNDTAEYTTKSARLAGEYFFGGIISFGLVVFALLVSSDCYFNAVTMGASVAVVVASALLLIASIAWGNHLAQRDDVSPGKTAAARCVLLAIYSPIVASGFSNLSSAR